MLREHTDPAREPGADGSRRWFSDEDMDLIVWLSPDGSFAGFELCYDKNGRERAFEWRPGGSLRHYAVDAGESTPLRNDSPILLPAGEGDRAAVLAGFLARAALLEPAVVDRVASALRV